MPTKGHSPRMRLFRYSAVPMLDLGYVREHPDVIEKMARDRGVTLDLAAFRELDAERRQIITSIERLKAERNKASEQIARLGKIVTAAIRPRSKSKNRLRSTRPAVKRRLPRRWRSATRCWRR